ncbi:hypothetical protein N656DRAFT_773610 [Canariomyces notabilis]|uniref:Uncharacterized protein n=1 Tax=Canariomyces notabilis TaxID=2074819 RepID=A0AAN6TN26_9PEZI|nr:hypothetical protein N656DRAFT_773610 [Canariomyces arenarius]
MADGLEIHALSMPNWSIRTVLYTHWVAAATIPPNNHQIGSNWNHEALSRGLPWYVRTRGPLADTGYGDKPSPLPASCPRFSPGAPAIHPPLHKNRNPLPFTPYWY